MAIFAERKQLIETFNGPRELRKPNRVIMNNSDVYRALVGEYVEGIERIPSNDPRMIEYRKRLKKIKFDTENEQDL